MAGAERGGIAWSVGNDSPRSGVEQPRPSGRVLCRIAVRGRFGGGWWALVAFLRAFPSLDGATYEQLVYGDVTPPVPLPPLRDLLEPAERALRESITHCERCHGRGGLGRGAGAFPKLAGQRSAYLIAALQAYARKERHSGMMEPIAASLNSVTLQELALYYGNLRSRSSSSLQPEDALAVARGKFIAERGIPNQRVPACVDCHGPTTTRRNPLYPELAGQYADYLVLQLELFKHERRGGSAYAHLMRPVATRLTTEQMRAVALYYESLTSTIAD